MTSLTTRMQKQEQIQQNIEIALAFLGEGKFSDSYDLFSEILKLEYKNNLAKVGAKTCKYWNNRKKIFLSEIPFEVASNLFTEWHNYLEFLHKSNEEEPKILETTCRFIFNTSLHFLKKDIQDNRINNVPALLMAGIAYKKTNSITNAIIAFERVLKIEKKHGDALAQLADCYALKGENSKAKVIYREALFVDPLSINHAFIDADIFKNLRDLVLQFKISTDELALWLPVYGRVLGVLNVTRELLPVELKKIKQDLFYLEQEVFKSYNSYEESAKTKLINHYLWLYDYYQNKNKTEDIQEIELKLKNVSSEIYSLLIKLETRS